MATVQDEYDLFLYDEAKTHTEKMRALMRIISRRQQVPIQDILKWTREEFYRIGLEVAHDLGTKPIVIPGAFARAFECTKPCCLRVE